MNEKEVIKNFLKSIEDDIEQIDGGCKYCINDFCDSVNGTIEQFGLRLSVSEEYPIRVTIEDV